MEREKVQVGVIAYRNPNNRNEFIRTVPLYEVKTPEIEAAEETVQTDVAKVLAKMMKHYVDGGGLKPQ